tara:strand:+ start:83 stop:511 length:429 start_codon:yes stop_codon:yes gene_type:complete
MDNYKFYNIICEVYKKDNNENYNNLLLDSVDWEKFYEFSNQIYSKFTSKFDDFEKFLNENNKKNISINFINVFNMGYHCCNTPMSIPYFYWSDYCWDLLENSNYDEQINIINNLPCNKCRIHAKKYIYANYVDLINMKKDIV